MQEGCKIRRTCGILGYNRHPKCLFSLALEFSTLLESGPPNKYSSATMLASMPISDSCVRWLDQRRQRDVIEYLADYAKVGV
jgi:hypothetical protein